MGSFLSFMFFIYSKYKSLVKYMFCIHFLPPCGLHFYFPNYILKRKFKFFDEILVVYFYSSCLNVVFFMIILFQIN